MRYRRLDLNLLIALDVLLAEKSVTRSATRLNVTQPAMSGALARLREYFEDPLVTQVGRQMELTPLAQSLVGPVRDIIMRIDAAIATEPAFDPAKSQRHFSITVSDYVVRVFLQEVLAYVHRAAPNITFELRQSSIRVQEELESGEVDIVIGPEIDVLTEHPQHFMFEDTYTLIAWAGSSVVGDAITFDDYLALNHVAFRTHREGRPWLERWFDKRYGDIRRIDVAAQNFTLLPHLVVGTDRIATVQTRLAVQYARVLPIKLIPPPLELPKLVEIMQWHVHRDQDPAGQWLRKVLTEHAAKLPAA